MLKIGYADRLAEDRAKALSRTSVPSLSTCCSGPSRTVPRTWNGPSRRSATAGAVVVGVSSLLLLLVFRSIWIPVKAAVLNLLSISAALGVITLVFQHGWFGAQPGPVEAFIPALIFAIVFGLSMDYEVFLISRIHEEWTRTKDHSHSVREGLASTGKVITAVAAIMIVVFAAFVLSSDRMLQQFGLGLAVAILLGAVVIRCLIVPSVIQMLGKWASTATTRSA
ncbi:MMPL family transporter [Streptomyces sp. HC307]|uniref:MMPL family transporter n=1 Tax=Streptomyces flavusporus TaxID=3385496 RepID=UPI0039172515